MKHQFVYEEGDKSRYPRGAKPTFSSVDCQTLRKCPYCKSKNYSKEVLTCKTIYFNPETEKYTTRNDVTDSGFSCHDCKININYDGQVEFGNLET